MAILLFYTKIDCLTQSIAAESTAFHVIGFTEGNSINDFNYSVFQKVVASEESKVKVKVDEEGTEAAAVTAIIMETCMAIMEDERVLLFMEVITELTNCGA